MNQSVKPFWLSLESTLHLTTKRASNTTLASNLEEALKNALPLSKSRSSSQDSVYLPQRLQQTAAPSPMPPNLCTIPNLCQYLGSLSPRATAHSCIGEYILSKSFSLFSNMA